MLVMETSEQSAPGAVAVLSHDEISAVFDIIDIPACPQAVTEALALAQRDAPDLNSLARAMAGDPGMVVAALRLANSATFGGGVPVTDIRTALIRLGIRNIVCVVIAAALRTTIKGDNPAYSENFWLRSTCVADAASRIARRQYGMSPDATYTYALFHDAGMPLMARRFPDYEQVLVQSRASGRPVIEHEMERFACSHAAAGALIARKWGLPNTVSLAVRYHHDPEVYDLPDRVLPGGTLSLIAATHMAEHILCDLQREEDLEVGDALFARAIEHFGLGEEDVEKLYTAIRA